MAYNQNFYNNVKGNNFTFQNQFPMPFSIPPPPQFSTPYAQIPHMSDQDFLKTFEKHLKHESHKQKPNINITELKAKLLSLITTHEEITEQHKILSENVDNFSDDEWKSMMNCVASKKEMVNKIIKEFNGSYMEQARKYLAKRTVKRARQKRLKEQRKQQKLEWIKEMKEKSRKIDENLQKIKDDNLKAKKVCRHYTYSISVDYIYIFD